MSWNLNAQEATRCHDGNTKPGQELRDLGAQLALHLVPPPFISPDSASSPVQPHFPFPVDPMEPTGGKPQRGHIGGLQPFNPIQLHYTGHCLLYS